MIISRIGFGEIMQKFLQTLLPRFGTFRYQPTLGQKSGKEQILIPYPRMVPVVEDGDSRDINATPVITRAFEKVVYHSHVKCEIERFYL